MPRSVTVPAFEVASSEPAGQGLAELPDEGWIPAVVPGGVHESLLAAGRIEHPYRDDHEADIGWIERQDWWYRATFEARAPEPGERVRMICDGLDTVAEVWLDGDRLGEHANVFRPAIFDVTGRVGGRHQLVLRFRPPLAGLQVPHQALALAAQAEKAFAGTGLGAPSEDGEAQMARMAEQAIATQRRKPPVSWGWDFAPRVPSVGLWDGVRLVYERSAVITGQHVYAEQVDAAAGTAQVAVRLDVERLADLPLTATATLTAPSGATTTLELEPTAAGFATTAHLADAALWWTHDLGEPHRYAVELRLLSGETELDRVSLVAGLRTITLDRSNDPEGGRRFRFVLNGVPIFARGANWVPADMLMGSVAPERVRDLVRRAREGAMTMIRIWGGGRYEQEAFYDACDAEGMLVWHDFMFACLEYPSDQPELCAEAEAEALHQVRRLRSHPCLALWCGNNEVQMLHAMIWHDVTPAGDWGWSLFHETIPAVVAAEGGSVPYWPGSPWGTDDTEPWLAVNGVRDGDRHAWEVWHGFDFGAGGPTEFPSIGDARHYRRYAHDHGRFISEFGIHASPVLSTLQRWVDPESLELGSPAFLHRNKDRPVDKHDAVLELVTGLPTSMEHYVDFTMVSQAEGLKFGIEHYRRAQPHTNGTLVWQLNDAWPGFSWSVIDYEGVPKAGYHYAARAFAPVIATFAQTDDGAELWVCNSTAAAHVGDLTVEIGRFSEGSVRTEQTSAEVAAGTSSVVWRGQMPHDHETYVWVSGDGIPDNRLFFHDVRDLAIPPTQLMVERLTDAVRVTAHGYAYFVHLLADDDPHARFSDNYRDLRPEETVTFGVEGVDPAQVRVLGYAGHDVTVL